MTRPTLPADPHPRLARAAAAAALLLAALLAGCVGGLRIDTGRQAASQGPRVDLVVLHYTALDAEASLRVLTEQGVSSHYLVDDRPPHTIYRLVDESRRAHHAGASAWGGRTQLNGTSLGVEIVNPGWQAGPDGVPVYAPYPPAQIERVVELLRDIVSRHGIRPDRIVGHADVSPGRKQDPGPRFPWRRLAEAGLVAWPDPGVAAALQPRFEREPPDVDWFQEQLARVGYEVPRDGRLEAPTRAALAAFQMRFRPSRHDGEPDAETAALLAALLAGGGEARARPDDGD